MHHPFMADRLVLVLAALLAAGACASGPKGGPGGERGPLAIHQTGAILAAARKEREEKGCAAAAPSLRVIAAMGATHEAAQHELGECLMTMTGATEVETALFREEGVFWLSRAAYAGNARAQRFLAVSLGAGEQDRATRADALKWALVYAANGDSDLYGFKALPATFIPGLKDSLTAADVAAAEAFAAGFSPILLSEFTPPAPDRSEMRRRTTMEGGPGQRRRRPQ